jgi:hypothetical protein
MNLFECVWTYVNVLLVYKFISFYYLKLFDLFQFVANFYEFV